MTEKKRVSRLGSHKKLHRVWLFLNATVVAGIVIFALR